MLWAWVPRRMLLTLVPSTYHMFSVPEAPSTDRPPWLPSYWTPGTVASRPVKSRFRGSCMKVSLLIVEPLVVLLTSIKGLCPTTVISSASVVWFRTTSRVMVCSSCSATFSRLTVLKPGSVKVMV